MGLFDIFKKKSSSKQQKQTAGAGTAPKAQRADQNTSKQQKQTAGGGAAPKAQHADQKMLSPQEIIMLAKMHEPAEIYESGSGDTVPSVRDAVKKILPSYGSFGVLPMEILMSDPESIMSNIRESDVDTLLIFLKFLVAEARRIPTESRGILESIQNYLMVVLQHRLSSQPAARNVSAFEHMQECCRREIKENPDAEETKVLVAELGKMILKLDKIYVAYDTDFNNQFPYMGIEGRIEVSTKPAIAKALQNHLHEQHLGHVSIREFEGKQIAETLRSYQRMGIRVLRLDNGCKPIDIWFKDILEPVSDNLMERCNNSVKGAFLRELQYGYRIRKMDPSEKGGNQEKLLSGMMLTMRHLAYREFGNGLCWVLASIPHQEGTTFYTEKALAKAREMLAEDNLPESALIAEGDNVFAVYDSDVNLRTTVNSRAVQTQACTLEDAFICAFTGHKEAEMVRAFFSQHGANDSILAITYDELCSHAMQCAGILIDMPTYGRELMKEEFKDVEACRAGQGKIYIAQ
ncbi:MAG: SseB family protein [Clostridia bacterium]|nr:SseB family protein [Clostridia bacterium]